MWYERWGAGGNGGRWGGCDRVVLRNELRDDFSRPKIKL